MRKPIWCDIHGRGLDAYLCIHLSGAEKAPGFVEADDEPGYGPAAWCNECEDLRVELDEDDWQDAIGDMLTLVCQECYDRAKVYRSRRPTKGGFEGECDA